MSDPRLDDHLVADGPDQAVRFSPASGGGLELLRRGLGHPVLTEVLRHLLERETQAAGRPIAYYEDSP